MRVARRSDPPIVKGHMMTGQLRADLLVIGWGKGGKTLAGARARQGDRVIIVEQSDQMYGGTCINVGCVPTKALVYRADQRRAADDAGAWHEQAIGAVQTLTAAMRQKNFDMLNTLDTVTVVTGRGSSTPRPSR